LENTDNIIPLSLIINLSLLLLFISIGIFILFNTFKKRIEREQQALREAEVNFERKINEASMKSELQERMQIAMDLHDEISTLMTILKISNHDAKLHAKDNPKLMVALEKTTSLINETSLLIRNISDRISPPTLAKFGLNATLIELIKSINVTNEFHIKYESNLEKMRFLVAAELNLYRILKETINNIIKHGQTTELVIQGNLNTEFLEFHLNYQGQGLSNDQVKELLRVSDRNGLKSIQSRVNNLHSTISYLFSDDKKASIHLKIPLHAIQN
jgi:signal transduction histidine kinase